MSRLNPTLKRALALFGGAFALYALTAQRGLGWGDSGEFQYRVLSLGWEGVLKGCDSFATAHPLYIVLCKLIAQTPFQVTLVSSFFGALSVALVFCLTRRIALALLFAGGHALIWLSTVSEVYTLSLAFFACELLMLRRFQETRGLFPLLVLAALNGLHLEVHNFALLAWPVYFWVGLRLRPRALWGAGFVWCLGAFFWFWCFCAFGPANVLFGRYGAQVFSLTPIIPAAVPLNLALGAMSLAVPGFLLLRAAREPNFIRQNWFLIVIFGVHFAFWSTYFVVSQFTFVLPSVLLLFVLARNVVLSKRLLFALVVIQLALPCVAWGLLLSVRFPSDYQTLHPGRDDALYFALPYHVLDRSADRAALLQPTPWNGYCDDVHP